MKLWKTVCLAILVALVGCSGSATHDPIGSRTEGNVSYLTILDEDGNIRSLNIRDQNLVLVMNVSDRRISGVSITSDGITSIANFEASQKLESLTLTGVIGNYDFLQDNDGFSIKKQK